MDVVLLHGALGSAAQLAPLKAKLEPTLTPHIVEFEGHGDTEPGDRQFRTRHFAENVWRICRRPSSSGLCCLATAWVAMSRSGKEAPERVAAVMTLGTKLGWNPKAAAREAGRLNPGALRTKVPRFVEALGVLPRTPYPFEQVDVTRVASHILDVTARL